MLFGVFLVLFSAYGIYHGIRARRPAVLIFSALGLLGTILVWAYFYQNPY
ncbi:hypothetical protein [Proteiniclasticum ruminis]|uniref:Uncharacterized protein n=1 Tax=Proteiniclasticum ruminis TaxID=398199 RepID=A0A1I5ECE6_9CLOT|nr:hypothetical protein [Proteiniclasticum ruminis]SFO09095.1 hypothetical protein SAMN04488695_11532 [Proteiniclasticum ruminis]